MDLVSRVKGILLTPKAEWAVIDTEPATVGSLYKGYIVPLAAIPAVAWFVGFSLIGGSMLGVTFRWPIDIGLEQAVARFVLALIGVYVLALIIDALAPNFGGQKNQIQALKVAAYSSTASWVAGIFLVLPALSILGILGLYSFYLLYLGLPVLMKSPPDKAVAYTVVVIVCAIVLFVVIRQISAQVFSYTGSVVMTP